MAREMRIYEDGEWKLITSGAITSEDETITYTAEDIKKGLSEAGKVQSVNGKTGTVIIDKADVGLGSVDNTSDINKPVSTATKTELNKKVDKVSGKQLSTNDYTIADKNEVAKVKNKAEIIDLKSLEYFEKGNEATKDNGEFYEEVNWYNKGGSIYATSIISGDILTLKYIKDNKVIKWKLYYDEDGFPFKKELI